MGQTRSSGPIIAMVMLACVGGLGGPSAQAQEAVDPAEKKLAAASGLLARGQYDMAKQEFNEFLTQYPKHAGVTRAKYGLALCAYSQNDLTTAATLLGPLVADKQFSQRADALSVLGHVQLAQGNYDKALAALDTLLKDYPKAPQAETAAINRAQALYQLGKVDEALQAAQAFLEAYPKSGHRAAATYLIALGQHATNQDAAAAQILASFVDTYPNSPYLYDAQLLLGECLQGQGKSDEAITHLQRLAADAPEAKKPAVYYGLGAAQVQAGRYADAEATLGAVIEKYPRSSYAGPAKLQVAVAQIKSGVRTKARATLAQLLKEQPGLAMTVSANYWLARCDLLEGKYDAAAATLDKLAAVSPAPPELPEIRFDRAYCDLMRQKDAEAIAAFEAFRKDYPHSSHNTEAIYYEASALHRLGQFDKSQALCDGLIKTQGPLARSAALLRAENIFMRGQYKQADEAYEALAQGATGAEEKQRIALRRGQCAYFSRDYTRAAERLAPLAKNQAWAQDPALQDAVFLLGDAQFQEGKLDDAVASFRKYLTVGKAHQNEATYKLAVALLRSKDTKGATETLETLMREKIASPWVQRGWYEYAQLCYQQKNRDEARKALQTVLEAKPEAAVAAPATYLQARMDLEDGKPGAAAKTFARIVADYPKDPLAEDAAFEQAVSLKEARQPAEAWSQFEAYAQRYPQGKYLQEAKHQAAVCLTALGKGDDAVKTLGDLAASKATRNDGVLYDLAWAYRATKDLPHAIDTYRQLLKEYPDSARVNPVRVELAEILYGQKQYADALTLLQAVLEDKSADGRSRALAQYRAGFCQARLGQPAKALEAFGAFMAENPKDDLVPGALYESGLAYAALGKFAEAKRCFTNVQSQYPSHENVRAAGIRLGEVQNQAGEYDAAAATFTQWLKDHPNDALAPLANFGIGWSLENRGKYEEARGYYDKVVAADNGPAAARAQFQIGETWFAQKKFDLAAKELLKVDILYAAPEWSARALYEAGRAFEQLKEPAKAREQFREVIKKYKDADVASLAQKRLDALGQ